MNSTEFLRLPRCIIVKLFGNLLIDRFIQEMFSDWNQTLNTTSTYDMTSLAKTTYIFEL